MLYTIAQNYLDNQFHSDSFTHQPIQIKILDERLIMDEQNVSYLTLSDHNLPLDDQITIVSYHIESSYNTQIHSPLCLFQINEIERMKKIEKVQIEIDLIDFESNPSQVRKMLNLITTTKKLHYKTQNTNKLSQLLKKSALMDDQNEIQITLSKRKMNNQQEEDENRDQNKKLTKSQRKYLDRLEKIANGLSLRYTIQYFKKYEKQDQLNLSNDKVYSRKIVEFLQENAFPINDSVDCQRVIKE